MTVRGRVEKDKIIKSWNASYSPFIFFKSLKSRYCFSNTWYWILENKEMEHEIWKYMECIYYFTSLIQKACLTAAGYSIAVYSLRSEIFSFLPMTQCRALLESLWKILKVDVSKIIVHLE